MAPRVGTRVARQGQTGTVSYIGPLPHYEGTFLGIVWDAKIGKHDGTGPDGSRYFVWYVAQLNAAHPDTARS